MIENKQTNFLPTEPTVAPFDREQTLLAETLDLFKARLDSGTSLESIVQETLLPYHWLRAMAVDRVKSPGVNRVQYLWEYLTGRKLFK